MAWESSWRNLNDRTLTLDCRLGGFQLHNRNAADLHMIGNSEYIFKSIHLETAPVVPFLRLLNPSGNSHLVFGFSWVLGRHGSLRPLVCKPEKMVFQLSPRRLDVKRLASARSHTAAAPSELTTVPFCVETTRLELYSSLHSSTESKLACTTLLSCGGKCRFLSATAGALTSRVLRRRWLPSLPLGESWWTLLLASYGVAVSPDQVCAHSCYFEVLLYVATTSPVTMATPLVILIPEVLQCSHGKW